MDEQKQDQTPLTPLPSLADMDWDQLETLNTEQLRQICKAENVQTGGKKKDLLDRLISKKNIGRGRFVQGQTRCCICGATLQVRNTSKQRDGAGLYIVRQVRCTGKHLHTYPIKEKIEADKRA